MFLDNSCQILESNFAKIASATTNGTDPSARTVTALRFVFVQMCVYAAPIALLALARTFAIDATTTTMRHLSSDSPSSRHLFSRFFLLGAAHRPLAIRD